MDNAKDIWGNLIGTDIQGNADDKNVQGERPKDAQGNVAKDIFGNPISSEDKPS